MSTRERDLHRMIPFVSLGRRATMASKARVLKGRMLPDEFFWDLLFKCKNIREIASQLRNSFSYGSYLGHIDISEVHRYQLESVLSMIPLYEAMRFRYFAGRSEWSVIDAWRAGYESDLLKRIIRHVFSGKGDKAALAERIHTIGEISFPAEKLLECETFDDILLVLKGTPYFDVTRAPLEKIEEQGATLFPVEMAIDSFVIKRLFKSTSGLHGNQKKQLAALLGTKADLLNLYWLYRSRKFFGMSPEEMISRILPFNYRLSKKDLQKLVFAPDLETFMDLMKDTWYGKFLEYPTDMDQGTLELVLERSISRIITDRAVKIFMQGSPGVHTVLAYLILREYEVRDLTTIIEDVRYDFSRRMAVLFLVRSMKAEGGS